MSSFLQVGKFLLAKPNKFSLPLEDNLDKSLLYSIITIPEQYKLLEGVQGMVEQACKHAEGLEAKFPLIIKVFPKDFEENPSGQYKMSISFMPSVAHLSWVDMIQGALQLTQAEKDSLPDDPEVWDVSDLTPSLTPTMSEEAGWAHLPAHLVSTPKESTDSEESTELYSESTPSPYSVEEGPQAQPVVLDV